MSILNAAVPVDSFNPSKDKIALMLKSFTILKKDGLIAGKYSEPYFVGLTISENSFQANQINFVTEPYPKTKRKDKREFLGNGMRIFGPDNPGEFLVFHVLTMESDKDVREAGQRIKSFMESAEVANKVLPMISGINPTVAIATEALSLLTKLIANQMKKNKDDELMLTTGTLLRDVMGTDGLPYLVGQSLSNKNDFVAIELEILGLRSNARHRRHTEPVGG